MPTPTGAGRLPAKGSYVRFKDGYVTRVVGHPKIKDEPEYDLEVGRRGGVLIKSSDVEPVSEAYWNAWAEGARGAFVNVEAHAKAGTLDAALEGQRWAARRAAERRSLGLPSCAA